MSAPSAVPSAQDRCIRTWRILFTTEEIVTPKTEHLKLRQTMQCIRENKSWTCCCIWAIPCIAAMNGIADGGICWFVSERVGVRSRIVCRVRLRFRARSSTPNTNIGVGQISYVQMFVSSKHTGAWAPYCGGGGSWCAPYAGGAAAGGSPGGSGGCGGKAASASCSNSIARHISHVHENAN